MPLSFARRVAAAALAFPIATAAAFCQADLTASPSYAPADPGRTAMDVGGTWNGTAEVSSGDTVSLLITNDGDAVAFDLDLDVTLPAGFTYAAGSASGLPGLSAVQSGQSLTFNLPMNTDLGPGGSETISFGLVAGTGVTSGTYSVDWDVTFGTTDGASDGSENVAGDVVVREGASLLTATPVQQSAAVGEAVTFDVTIKGTGLGGLFDVTVDESLLSPTNAAGSLTFVSMVETSPGGTGVLSGSTLTFPYLGPDESATVRITANVTGCETIDNPVSTTDRTGATAASLTLAVAIDLTQPLISITTDNLQPTFVAGDSFSGSVQNVGLGSASSLTLDSTLEGFGVVVSNVSPDWSYTPGNGTFTYVAGGGVLANGATSTLSFDIAAGDPCIEGGGGTLVWAPSYLNVCGDPYATPVVTSSIGAVSGRPTLGVTLTADKRRIDVNEPATASVTLAWTERDLIATDPLVVSVQIAGVFNGVAPGPAPVGAVSGVSGNAFTWSIPKASLAAAGSETLTVDFTAPSDPCQGGIDFSSTAGVTATSAVSVSGGTCALDDADAVLVLVTNAPTGPLNQQFNVQTPGDGTWETGVFDDGDGVREDNLGEGEFITYTASYDFGTPFTGTWSGSSFKDFLAGLATQDYVSGSAMVSVDGGGLQALAVSAPDVGESGIKIDLAQVEALAGDPNLQGHDIVITYQTVVTDAFLGAAVTGEFTELVQLTVGAAAGDAAACNMGEYTQGAFVTVARAAAEIQVSVPSQLDTCEEFDLVLTVSNGTPEKPSNPAGHVRYVRRLRDGGGPGAHLHRGLRRGRHDLR